MELYPQQKEALNTMTRFIESEDSIFILKGYAGTGKTTMIKSFCEVLGKYKRNPKLMAPTGRAAKVLGEKTSLETTTIHKAIYHRTKFEVVRHDEDGNLITMTSTSETNNDIDDMNIYFGINKITDAEEAKNMVIIVDEASLISSKPSNQELIHFGTDILMADLLTYAQLTLGSKVVFVGDPAQLPPVGDNQSYALSEEYFNTLGLAVSSFTLTDVLRQHGDSIVLDNAMKVRNLLNSTLRNELCFKTKDGEVEAITAVEVVEKYTEMFPSPKLSQSVVICYSNTKTQDYNRAIRQQYYTSQALQKGDVLQVVRNNYNVMTAEGALLNGDFIRIVSTPDTVEDRKIPVWTNREGKRERVYIELEFQNIDFETDRGSTGSAKILTSLLHNNRPTLTREESVALYIDFVIRHSSLRRHDQDFAYALMEDPYFNALQAKFGYAITGHKSQGGEWHTVFVDYSGRTGLDNDSLRWKYTATTRASHCLYGVSIPNITPFNKFSISPIQTATKMQSEVLCVKDSACSLLSPTATPAQKAKCNSIESALAELNCTVLSVSCMAFRDRYKIHTPSGEKEFDCNYNGAGCYTSYESLKPFQSDTDILKALEDEHCYQYEYNYTPSINCLEKLLFVATSAADELGIRITGIKEYAAQYYVLYGLRTTATFATLQFYFNGKGFITNAKAASIIGNNDVLLEKLINRIQEITCPQ